MPNSITSLIIAGLGAVTAAAFQHLFQQYAETRRIRREIIETRLLQLQNSVESLYYRANNLLDWGGQATMSQDYYEKTSVFVLARVLGHELLFASSGIYAKLQSDKELKSDVKAALHKLNSAMDQQGFLYYYRVLLGEMALDGDRVITLTEFLSRWQEPRFASAIEAASAFVAAVDSHRLEHIRALSGALVARLAKKTGVPSALDLTGRTSTRAPA